MFSDYSISQKNNIENQIITRECQEQDGFRGNKVDKSYQFYRTNYTSNKKKLNSSQLFAIIFLFMLYSNADLNEQGS